MKYEPKYCIFFYNLLKYKWVYKKIYKSAATIYVLWKLVMVERSKFPWNYYCCQVSVGTWLEKEKVLASTEYSSLVMARVLYPKNWILGNGSLKKLLFPPPTSLWQILSFFTQKKFWRRLYWTLEIKKAIEKWKYSGEIAKRSICRLGFRYPKNPIFRYREPSLIRACLCVMGSYEICKTTACSYLKKKFELSFSSRQ